MLTLLLATLAAAPTTPVAGSRWQWRVEERKSAVGRVVINQRLMTFIPYLPGATFDVKVLESGETVPAKLEVSAVNGLPGLSGVKMQIENSYGEAIFTRVRTARSPPPEDDDNDNMHQRKLRTLLGLLVKADPVVAAVAAGQPCSKETLEAVAKGAGTLAQLHLARGGSDEISYLEGTAQCLGGGAAKRYSVKFTLHDMNGSIDYPFSGTVEVPPGAWRSTFAVKCNYTFAPEGARRKLGVKGSISLKSRMARSR